MTSLVAIPLLVLWIALGFAVLAARRGGRGGPSGRVADAFPALVVLWVVLGVSLAGWLIAVALAQR